MSAETTQENGATPVANFVYVDDAIRDFAAALRANNIDNREYMSVLVAVSNGIMKLQRDRPNYLIANDLMALKSLVARCKIPREDETLGQTQALRELRAARGTLLTELDEVLGRLNNTRLDDDKTHTQNADRQLYLRELRAIEERLRRTEGILIERIAPEKQNASKQQFSLVNFYVNTMSIELALAKLEIGAKGVLNLELLAKIVHAMGELTADFFSTLIGLKEKVTDSLKSAGHAIRKPLGRATRTLAILTKREIRRSVIEPSGPGEASSATEKSNISEYDESNGELVLDDKKQKPPSTSQEIAQYIPYLRRFARTLAGGPSEGDALVLQTLESLIANPNKIDESDDLRTAIYGSFLDLYEQAKDKYALSEKDRLARLSYTSLVAFLLETLEGFSLSEIASTMKVTASEVTAFLKTAGEEIQALIKSDVLIVEDEPFISMDLQTVVEDLGHRVVGLARTKSEALELFQAHLPKLVLMDIALTDGNTGLDAVNEMLQISSAVIIFITAYPELFLTGNPPGQSFLITKPFAVKSLIAVISQALFFDRTCFKENAE